MQCMPCACAGLSHQIQNALLCSDRGPETCLPVLVTASVDAIELLERLTLDRDLQVSGQVVWTGRSSLDIKMQMSQVSSTSLALTDLLCSCKRMVFILTSYFCLSLGDVGATQVACGTLSATAAERQLGSTS